MTDAFSARRVSYPGIDVAKLLMAVVVVEIHSSPLGQPTGLAGSLLESTENVAVPFFFIASGFLCFRGLRAADVVGPDAPKSGRTRRTALRLLRLYAIWTLVFLPVSAFGYWLQGCGLAEAVLLWARGVLLVGEAAFSWPLWYLLAAAVGFGLLHLMLRGGVPPRRILCAAFLLMLAGWGLTLLHGWEGAPVWVALPVKAYFAVFVTVRNGLFLGFFYVSLGAVMGLRSDVVGKMGLLPICALLTVGLGGCLLLSPAQSLPFCASLALGVFLLSARMTSEGPGHKHLRNLSTVVYLTHMILVVVLAYGVFGGRGGYARGVRSPHVGRLPAGARPLPFSWSANHLDFQGPPSARGGVRALMGSSGAYYAYI